MAYTPYPYPNYGPYYGQPVPDQLAQLRQNQFQQQPVMQAMQTMQQQPVPPQIQPANPISSTQNNGMIWVSGQTEAANWPIAPGCAVALWDSNNPVIYLRQADSTGKPSTKVYDLVERTDAPVQQQAAPQIDLSRYITIEAAEEIIDRRVNDILTERLKRPSKPVKTKEDTENNGQSV